MSGGQSEERGQTTASPGLTEDVLLIVPVRNVVVFPGGVTEVVLTRDLSIAAAQEAEV